MLEPRPVGGARRGGEELPRPRPPAGRDLAGGWGTRARSSRPAPRRVSQATAGTPTRSRPLAPPPLVQPILALHIGLRHRKGRVQRRSPGRGCPGRRLPRRGAPRGRDRGPAAAGETPGGVPRCSPPRDRPRPAPSASRSPLRPAASPAGRRTVAAEIGRVLTDRWAQVGRMRQPAPPPPPPQPPSALRDVALDVAPVLSGRAAAMGANANGTALPERLRLPVCFLGVFACYFYYGILQESM